MQIFPQHQQTQSAKQFYKNRLKIYSIQIGFREIRLSYFCSQQSKKLRCNRLLQYFFNEVVGKKNKHKNRKAIWFE